MRIAAALTVLLLAQAPPIAGVIAPGTTIELVTYPVQGTEGPVGMPDGILFTETRADRITRVDLQGNTSTYVEKSNGSNGLGFDVEEAAEPDLCRAGQEDAVHRRCERDLQGSHAVARLQRTRQVIHDS